MKHLNIIFRSILYQIQNEMNPLSVSDVNMRTTSSLEALNSVLKRTFTLHPNIFKFMDRLKVYEFGKQLQMFNLLQEDPSETFQRRKLIDRLRDEKIQTALHKLRYDMNFTIGDFFYFLSVNEVFPSSGEKQKVKDIDMNILTLTYLTFYLYSLQFAERE